jgi:hypothetical protein
LVVWEGVAEHETWVAGIGTRTERIINLDRLAGGVDKAAEISIYFGGSWYQIKGAVRCTKPIPFITPEEEGPIFPVVYVRDNDRASDITPELVPSIGRDFCEKGIAGVEGCIAKKLPDCTVKLVAAGFRHHVDDTAYRPTELRLVVVGIQLEFLDGV